MCLSLSFFSLSLLFLFLQIPEAEKKDPNELVGEFTYFYVHTYVWSKRKKAWLLSNQELIYAPDKLEPNCCPKTIQNHTGEPTCCTG